MGSPGASPGCAQGRPPTLIPRALRWALSALIATFALIVMHGPGMTQMTSSMPAMPSMPSMDAVAASIVTPLPAHADLGRLTSTTECPMGQCCSARPAPANTVVPPAPLSLLGTVSVVAAARVTAMVERGAGTCRAPPTQSPLELGISRT